MKRIGFTFALLAAAAAVPALADSIDFGQFGPEQINIAGIGVGLNGVTADGVGFLIETSLGFSRLDQGSYWQGHLPAGTKALFNSALSNNGGEVRITFDKPIASLHGLYVDPVDFGLINTYARTYNGNNQLEIHSFTDVFGLATTLPIFNFSVAGIEQVVIGATSYSGGFAMASASSPTGVPEPASWALLIAGFGLTGAALRRRRVLSIAD